MSDITGIGAVADLIRDGLDKAFPDKTEIEKQQMAAAMLVVQGQIDTNKIEAASPTLFVAGWRPAIGWVCGAACAWNWIGFPIFKFATTYFNHPVNVSPADVSEMLPLLMGMLGLGGLRTFEKINGVAAK